MRRAFIAANRLALRQHRDPLAGSARDGGFPCFQLPHFRFETLQTREQFAHLRVLVFTRALRSRSARAKREKEQHICQGSFQPIMR